MNNSPLASVKQTHQLLTSQRLKAKKHFGQNFIIESKVVEKIAQQSGITENTAVVEIGAGLGGLTEQLLKLASYVISYEIDRDLFGILKETLVSYPHLTLINQDFLQSEIKRILDDLKKQYAQVVLVANLPYYITTPILFYLIEQEAYFDQMTLMLQKEVAERLLAVPATKAYGSLSIIIQYLFNLKKVMLVKPEVFYPQPKVDSIVLSFKPKIRVLTSELEPAYFQFVKKCFRFRRKILVNNLKDDYELASILKALDQLKLDQQIRAEALSTDEYLQLFQELYEKKILR